MLERDRGRETKDMVRAFWNARPCGSTHATAPEGSKDFFEQVERRRYELEPFIDRFADFASADGKKILEIGVGLGTDFVRFARTGATVTGIDTSERSVDLVKRRLALEGLNGEVLLADAEDLPFPDASFDYVYSWGVLHHTPDTARAVAEAVRVLRPGGRMCVMLYSRHSWVVFALWVRYALLRGRLRTPIDDILAHHMESHGTKAFSKKDLRTMFNALPQLRIEKVATPYDRRIAGPLARVTGKLLGWFTVIRGSVPGV